MPLVATDGSWAACLPKKTASQSLVGACEAAGTARVEGEWHGADWAGTGRRLLVVRDPRERLASMYWWSLKEQNWNRGPGGPAEWFARFRELRAAYKPADREWVASQRELAAAFRPDVVFRLEDGLAAVLAAVGLDSTHERRANVTAGKRSVRRPFAETFPADLPGLPGWLAEDAGEWYGDLLR